MRLLAILYNTIQYNTAYYYEYIKHRLATINTNIVPVTRNSAIEIRSMYPKAQTVYNKPSAHALTPPKVWNQKIA